MAAVSSRRAVAVVTARHGAIILAAYQVATSSVSGRVGGLLTIVLPVVTVARLVALVVGQPERFWLRRVDIDAPSGQLGAELVQGGERGV